MDSIKYLSRLLRGHFGITENDLSHLRSLLTWRGLDKGEPLIVSGRRSPIAGLVSKGCLRIFFTESDGSDRVLYFAPEGWLVPGVEALTATASNGLAIDALEPTEVWMLEDTSHAPAAAPPEHDRIWRALAECALLDFQKRLVGGMRKSASQRYAEFRKLYPDLESRIAQYHVAAYLGISPEFLSKLRRRHLRLDDDTLSTSTA